MYKKYQSHLRFKALNAVLMVLAMAGLTVSAYWSAPDVKWQAVSLGLSFGMLFGVMLPSFVNEVYSYVTTRRERDKYIARIEDGR